MFNIIVIGFVIQAVSTHMMEDSIGKTKNRVKMILV